MYMKTFTAPVRSNGGRTQALKSLDKEANDEAGKTLKIVSWQDKEYPFLVNAPRIIARTVVYE